MASEVVGDELEKLRGRLNALERVVLFIMLRRGPQVTQSFADELDDLLKEDKDVLFSGGRKGPLFEQGFEECLQALIGALDVTTRPRV